MTHRSRSLEFRDQVAIKRQAFEDSVAEADRTRWAGRVASAGGFRVPRVIELQDDGSLIFERIDGLETLTSVARRTDARHLWRRAGLALAAVHNAEPPADPTVMRLPGVAADGGPDVPLHTDFTPLNCAYRSASDELVLLDWASPDWFAAEGTIGPAAVDVSIFLLNTMFRRPFERKLRASRQLRSAFMAGYLASRGAVPGLGPIGTAIVARYARLHSRDSGWRTWLRAPALAHCCTVLWGYGLTRPILRKDLK